MFVPENFGLYTDMYQLTMAQGYFFSGKGKQNALFDYFFRTAPFQGTYVIFAGLETFLNLIDVFQFSQDDIEWLKQKGFQKEFLDYLKEFHFQGDIHSVLEGEVIFPNTPILQVEGNLIECQLIETALLNVLNYQSLIATKAQRICQVAGERLVADFGMRRAHGLAATWGSRAAVIGGAQSTSNVWAGKEYGTPVVGTQAHSWIQSFPTELEAFRVYADIYPDSTVLLIDTYDTLKSGLPNAITIARELRGKGHELKGIRLDSGDLAYLSKACRQILDREGFPQVKIIASNRLDEFIIKSLLDQGSRIDLFGVGTKLITGQPDAALGGVYKLAELDGEAKMKFSENIVKMTFPAKKKVLRILNGKDQFYADAVILDSNKHARKVIHPFEADKFFDARSMKQEEILHPVMQKGRKVIASNSITHHHQYLQSRIGRLPVEHLRFEHPHLYKVGYGKDLLQLRSEIINKYRP